MTFQKLLPDASYITHSICLRHPFQPKFSLPPRRFPFALQLSFQLQLSSNILFQSQFSFVTSITDFTLVAFYWTCYLIFNFQTWIWFSVTTCTANFTSVSTSLEDFILLVTSITDFIPFATTMVPFKIKFGWNLHHRFHLHGIHIAHFILTTSIF